MGYTAQRACGDCAVRIFVRLSKFDAGLLAQVKENLGKMTEQYASKSSNAKIACVYLCGIAFILISYDFSLIRICNVRLSFFNSNVPSVLYHIVPLFSSDFIINDHTFSSFRKVNAVPATLPGSPSCAVRSPASATAVSPSLCHVSRRS